MHSPFLGETIKRIRTSPLSSTPGSYPALLIEGLQVKDTPLCYLPALMRELIPKSLFLDRRTGNSRVSKIYPRNYQGTEGDQNLLGVSWFHFHCNLESCAISIVGSWPNFVRTTIVCYPHAIGYMHCRQPSDLTQSCTVWVTFILWLCWAQGPLLLHLDPLRFTLNTLHTIEQVHYLTHERSHIVSSYAGSLDRNWYLPGVWWVRNVVEIGLPYWYVQVRPSPLTY